MKCQNCGFGDHEFGVCPWPKNNFYCQEFEESDFIPLDEIKNDVKLDTLQIRNEPNGDKNECQN
jgi:hypothetical protein